MTMRRSGRRHTAVEVLRGLAVLALAVVFFVVPAFLVVAALGAAFSVFLAAGFFAVVAFVVPFGQQSQSGATVAGLIQIKSQ